MKVRHQQSQHRVEVLRAWPRRCCPMGPGGLSKRKTHARYYLRGCQMAPEGMLGLRVASPATSMQV